MHALAITKSGKLKLSEKQITEQCIGLLRAKGWLCIRLETGTFQRGGKNIAIGEKGQPDWICICSGAFGSCVVFVEFKTSIVKLSKDQEHWHGWAMSRGYDVAVVRGLADLEAWA